MKHSLKIGLCFGCTSGIITTLGLMVGLHAGTNSRLAVLGGILTIAIADAFSDALGIHVSEESEGVHSSREIWESTLTSFAAKFMFASMFILPIFLLELSTAIVVSVLLGLLLLGLLSFALANEQQGNPWPVVGEHVSIAVVVVVVTHYVGDWVSLAFA
jgi:VIT1/CCC1 family predicted Fe2+/Mn2+ transporter